MKWLEMTGVDVAELAQRTDVAIVPVGCVEWHGPHLPTGNDGIVAEHIAVRAAEIEPAIVLPTIYFNINDQMKCYNGTLSFPPRIVADLYHALCTEAARNGFRKIIFFIGHGGSQIVVDIVQAELLERITSSDNPGYFIFWCFIPQLMQPELSEIISSPTGHACEFETSLTLAIAPHLVRMDRVSGKVGPVHERAIPMATYRVDWKRRVPEGFIGYPERATSEKGERLIALAIQRFADVIRQVKQFDPDEDR